MKYKQGTHPNSHKPTKKSNIKRRKKLKGKTWTSEQNKKRKKKLTGHKVTKETKDRIKQSLKKKFPKGRPINSGNFKKGRFSWNKGIKGKNSHSWQGGISFEPYSFNFNEELKMLIRKRDNFKCQICFAPAIVVHHIDYNKKNNNPENLITLCRSCHGKTNNNRIKWIKFFKEKLK